MVTQAQGPEKTNGDFDRSNEIQEENNIDAVIK
jgi:hypothetical protein